MNVENISLQPSLKTLGVDSWKKEGGLSSAQVSTQPFDSFFKSYLGLIEETSLFEVQAEKAQIDYATGKTDDMLSVMLSQEKAFSSLNFTVQVTSKVIEAYKEIMRISI